MTTPDKAQQPDHDAQELTDENLNQVSGGYEITRYTGVDGELDDATAAAKRPRETLVKRVLSC